MLDDKRIYNRTHGNKRKLEELSKAAQSYIDQGYKANAVVCVIGHGEELYFSSPIENGSRSYMNDYITLRCLVHAVDHCA